jgi:hypothetical protein
VSLHQATYPPAFDRNDSLSIFERRAATTSGIQRFRLEQHSI